VTPTPAQHSLRVPPPSLWVAAEELGGSCVLGTLHRGSLGGEGKTDGNFPLLIN
jgi:hypothetical protein